MSKKELQSSGEHRKDAIHDNKMFAERAFYCIANGASELFFRRFILCVDPLQICVDEGVETAVQYAVCICNLLICPKVLHQLIRLQDIGTDLVAPCDILDLATDVRKLLGVFFLL